MGDHSSGTALADRLARPTRMEREDAPVTCVTPIPIRSCSRRGLPCHPCHQERGALLPHPFTLTAGRIPRRFAFCGAIPRVTLPNPCGPGCFPGRTLSAALPTWSPDFPPTVARQRSPGRPIERRVYHPDRKRAIPPPHGAKTPQISKNCAWLWPVQVSPITSRPNVIWREL